MLNARVFPTAGLDAVAAGVRRSRGRAAGGFPSPALPQPHVEKETQYLERVLADARLGRTVVELFSLGGGVRLGERIAPWLAARAAERG